MAKFKPVGKSQILTSRARAAREQAQEKAVNNAQRDSDITHHRVSEERAAAKNRASSEPTNTEDDPSRLQKISPAATIVRMTNIIAPIRRI